ncbi:hypothetical protein AHAS_Ahas14G0006000 [Arachis hypogaea]|uniref:Uncharacterized protein n=1 Tax=Arachis hypogaea TaxID=3818 RepID=A0A444ZB37_ARAHY|nr:hypothetical protein Ahy_B04g068930 isoform A [Arachis hypogaea]RYR11390.1 hypothetical protein Ahy_B04g068930 isoform C [Arachis hypogaea]
MTINRTVHVISFQTLHSLTQVTQLFPSLSLGFPSAISALLGLLMCHIHLIKLPNSLGFDLKDMEDWVLLE